MNLTKAIKIARDAHRGQKDKSGIDYIYHPLYVMSQMFTEDEMIVAVLHDVVEDTNITIEQLQSQGFQEHIIYAIAIISRNEGTTYKDYIRNVSSSPLATRVKIADLRHNMSPERMKGINTGMLKRYQWALDYLYSQYASHIPLDR
jgi:(p)ppGpp synthase/HD superfamily hydrolase